MMLAGRLLKTDVLRAFIWADCTKGVKALLLLAIFSVFAAGLLPYALAQADDPAVVLHTASGKIAIEFFSEDAPNHVDNFVRLSSEGFYDGTVFHRVISGFMIQGGDPLTREGASDGTAGWGTGDPGYTIDAEFNSIKHVRGIVSMARSADPDSAGSQFFIVHADAPHLDGMYTAFGRIVTQESLETLDKIAGLQTTPHNNVPIDWGRGEILRAEVVSRSELPGVMELDAPMRAGSAMQDDGPYTSEKLGITFMPPTGWLLQEPPKTSPVVPDVVAVARGTAGIDPSVSVSIAFSGDRSLDEYIAERKQLLQPAIDGGQLEIIADEGTTVHGREGYVINAQGAFPSEGEIIDVLFREITFYEDGKFYVLTYTNAVSDFDSHVDEFEQVLATFSILDKSQPAESATPEPLDTSPTEPAQPAPQATQQDPPQQPLTAGEDNGCLIATAAYGSEMAPQVQLLREIRDGTVLQTRSGSAFMAGFNQVYYSFSPTVADWERQNPAFKEAVKVAIAPMLATLAVLNHADIDSEPEMIGYGLGIIALNVGMYLAAPAMIIWGIRRKQSTRRRPHRQEPCTPSPRPVP